MPQDPKQYAHDIYHVLRELDKKNYHEIVIEKLPEGQEWDGMQFVIVNKASAN